MSYSRSACRTTFSAQQYARIYAGFQLARHYFACPSFYVDFTTGNFARDCNEMTVQFTDNSPSAISWEWDVDGDDVIDYTIPNPNHVYTVPGLYDVALTVSDGSTTLTDVFWNLVIFETETVNTVQVNLELFTDNWCEETTWEFKDENDTVLYSGGPYTANVEDLTLFNYAFDVDPNNCYTFAIYDSYGDGICCFSGNGYYELTTSDDSVIVTGGEIGFGETTYISNSTLSVDENFVDSLGLYPNPTSDQLNIKLKHANILPDSYKIYNMLGQLVSTKDIKSVSDLSIDASRLSNGMYFIKIEKENSIASLTFIKK
jgi:PKD repeat protein